MSGVVERRLAVRLSRRMLSTSEALLLSVNVAGSEPASVICTLAAECRSFVLWLALHCVGRMLVGAVRRDP